MVKIISTISSSPYLSLGLKYSVALGGCLLVHSAISYFGRQKLRNKTKWYLLHTVGNGIIVALTAKDMLSTTFDPIGKLNNYPDCHHLLDHSLYPVIIMSSMHLYHIMLYFREMEVIDWIHHLASSGLVGSLCTFYFRGSIVNQGLFFMCGLPGGLDYLMLSLNDLGYLERRVEKKINCYLNMYIRMPGILLNCYSGLVNYIYHPEYYQQYSPVIGSLVFWLNYWNATYFAQRVVENYGKTIVKDLIRDKWLTNTKQTDND